MTLPLFSLNVNGNWIDVRTEGFWRPRIIIGYNGEPLVNEEWSDGRAYEFGVEEEGLRTVYSVKAETVVRAVGYVVKRNGVLLLVTQDTRDWVLSREKEAPD